MNKKCRKVDTVAKQGSRSKPGIFAMIAKISLGLRKFLNHSENFASLAKFSLCENFARLAKFTVASEISDFRYLCRISLG